MRTQARLSRRALLALLLPVALVPHGRAAAPMDERQALHLLNRLGYGPAPGEVARVRALGASAYVDSQLTPPSMPPRLSDRSIPADEEALLYAIASPRQLEEVLTAFWLDHFRLTGDAARAALRPHVLGRYVALRRHAGGRGAGERAALQALLRHFVSAPSARLQRSLAQVWESTGGEQRAVLRALLTSPEFLAPAEWNSKRKDGFRFVASALRASGVAVDNVAPLMAFVRGPLGEQARTRFVEELAGGRLALATAPVPPQRYASSAPPMRASVAGDPPQGTVSQPGPVLMAAPTPSAAAMAAAARTRPADPDRLRALLGSEEFLRY